MQSVDFSTGNLNPLKLYSKSEIIKKAEETKSEYKKYDSLSLSGTSKVFNKIDSFLNLGKPDRLNTDDLNSEEQQEFLKILASLLKKGIIGYEILEVNGKPEKHFIVNQIGDERLKGAKLWKKDDNYKPERKY